LILHVQTTRLKLKGTAAKFCCANSKAIQQVNPTLVLSQLCMVALWLDWQLADNKKRPASQTSKTCVRVRFMNNLASKLERADAVMP